MANYNLTQTGEEVQAYIDSIPVIDVTGTLSGSNIVFATNPYTQIAANYAADCGSVIRLNVAGDVYVIRITGYDSTYYTGSVFKDNQYISVEIGESSAQGMIEDANAVALIPVTGTSSGGNITLSSNPFAQVQTAVNAGQHVVVRVTIASDIIDFTMNTYSASVATYIGTANFLENEFQLLCSASSAVITNRSTSNTFSTGESVPSIGIDDTPTQGSDNLVKSGGVWEELSGVVYNKDCFKLLYFKSAAPSTMPVGESFFNTNTNLIRRKTSSSNPPTFETVPFDYDFYFNDETGKFYTWDGSAMVEYVGVPHLSSVENVIYGRTNYDIEFIGADGSSLSVGQSFYDTTTNRIRKKTGDSTFQNVPFIFDVYYNKDDGKNYVWNGTTLVETENGEELGLELALKGVTCYEFEKFATTGSTLEYGQSYFNTNTKLIRKRISYDGYVTIPFEYDLYYNKATATYYYWDGAHLLPSIREPQKGVLEKVNELYKPEQPDNALFLYQTDWLATSRNYILRVSNGVFYHSSDLGKTWVSLANTIGIITFVHWFSDGTCLICGEKKAYTTKDWTALTESTIYDADGTLFSGENRNFFPIGNYNSDICVVNGQEVALWCDYGNSASYVSRLWCAEQNGSVIRCILKNNESVIGGQVFSCTHFHDCVWDKYDKCLWISTGDYAATSHLIRATYNNGWQFEVLQSGLDFKFAGLLVDEYYLYCMTDYTEDMDTGIKRVLKANASNASAYTFIYKTEDGTPMLNLYEDESGKKVLTPDSIPDKRGTFLYADKDMNFQEKTFLTNNNLSLSLHHFYGPNYNGDMLAITSTGYGFSPGLTERTRYLFSRAMWEAGYKNFAKGKLL